MNTQISGNAVLTDFGLLCRAHRIEQNKTIADQAKAMGIPSSRIAKIETRSVPIGKNYLRKFVVWTGLSLLEHQKLLLLSLRPQKTEKVFEGSVEKSRAAWRALNEIPTWSIPSKKKIVSAVFGDKDPKRQSNRFELPQDLVTVERTFEQIEKTVRTVLRRAGVLSQNKFDILHFIECHFSKVFPHFALLPAAKSELPGRNIAITRFKEGFLIKVREDIYTLASTGDAKARYVVAHEFAHMLFHRALPKSLMDGDQERKLLRNHLNFSVEFQADRGAICLLAPRNLCVGARDAFEIQDICNVPYELAKLAADEYGISRRAPQPYEKIHLEIGRRDAEGRIDSPLTYLVPT